MPQYKLKDGIELHPYGETSLINNDNLTDAMAEFLIDTGKADLNDFELMEAPKGKPGPKPKQ